jgi:hypothetical protein
MQNYKSSYKRPVKSPIFEDSSEEEPFSEIKTAGCFDYSDYYIAGNSLARNPYHSGANWRGDKFENPYQSATRGYDMRRPVENPFYYYVQRDPFPRHYYIFDDASPRTDL